MPSGAGAGDRLPRIPVPVDDEGLTLARPERQPITQTSSVETAETAFNAPTTLRAIDPPVAVGRFATAVEPPPSTPAPAASRRRKRQPGPPTNRRVDRFALLDAAGLLGQDIPVPESVTRWPSGPPDDQQTYRAGSRGPAGDGPAASRLPLGSRTGKSSCSRAGDEFKTEPASSPCLGRPAGTCCSNRRRWQQPEIAAHASSRVERSGLWPHRRCDDRSTGRGR